VPEPPGEAPAAEETRAEAQGAQEAQGATTETRASAQLPAADPEPTADTPASVIADPEPTKAAPPDTDPARQRACSPAAIRHARAERGLRCPRCRSYEVVPLSHQYLCCHCGRKARFGSWVSVSRR